MMHIIRYFVLFAALVLAAESGLAQVKTFKELHKVKRKETLFGIAREYGITLQELINANPEMNTPGYELKKGDYIKIPFPASAAPQPAKEEVVTKPIEMPVKPETVKTDMRQRELRVGVMLPLHTQNGDGKRMLEYYRGVLMACDSLRAVGISTDVRAWNVAEESNIATFLEDEHAADRDVIIGPLYSKQAKALGDFAREHDIRLFIPFSISTTQLDENPCVFQVYQNGYTLNEAYANRLMERYKGHHVIIVDCNDSTSTKGGFTSTIRRKLEADGQKYSITNLRASENLFQRCFFTDQPNVVILNTSRSAELNVAFAKLNGLMMNNPQLDIKMFGYPEWLMYTRSNLDNFYKYDVCIPTTYYMSPLSPHAERFALKYRWNFHQAMQNYHARYAVTGFDHAFFLLKGLHMYGKQFTGASKAVGYTALQTPLNFQRVGNGGWQNRAMLLVHYTREQKTETLSF
ncbi:MAG: LysM peptidoglycan-binding domain-containing protein [Prevotella sp.]|nr:LysM peptidoglycan-binding domain-containing protein [Prevotella sp.]